MACLMLRCWLFAFGSRQNINMRANNALLANVDPAISISVALERELQAFSASMSDGDRIQPGADDAAIISPTFGRTMPCISMVVRYAKPIAIMRLTASLD